MKTLHAIASAPAVLLVTSIMTANVSNAAQRAAGPADDDWGLSIVQENEGLPKSNHWRDCEPTRRSANDAQRTANACGEAFR